MKTVPQVIYNYIVYATGDAAGPCAKLVTGEVSYTLHQSIELPSWRAYVSACKDGKPIRLIELPFSNAGDWEILG